MLERLADAAAALLEEKSLNEISIAEIAARAEASVGSFYRRFHDKTALLHYLDERLAVRSRRILEGETSEMDKDLRSVLRGFLEPWVQTYWSDRGIRRALHLRARVDPAFRNRSAETEQAVVERFTEALAGLPALESIARQDRKRLAGQMALNAIGFLRETVLFREHQVIPTPDTQDDVLDVLTASLEGIARRFVERHETEDRRAGEC
jgi:AcrR family transcriptional regulator